MESEDFNGNFDAQRVLNIVSPRPVLHFSCLRAKKLFSQERNTLLPVER